MDRSEIFRNCIASAAAGYALSDAETAVIHEITQDFPWFMTARLLYAESAGVSDIPVRLHYTTYGRRGAGLKVVVPEEFVNEPFTGPHSGPQPHPRSEDVIEKFLNKGEYRIVPDDSTPDDDAAARSADFDVANSPVSEELAQIYLAQGLNNRAKKIYERLSLLNPEKSIYFAEIIEGIGDEP